MSGRAALGLLAFFAGVGGVSGASASTCFREPGSFVLPLAHVPAPLNARPVVRLLRLDEDNQCYDPVCADEVERVLLVEAPRSRRGAIEIPTVVTAAQSGRTKTFYLAPTEALSRETRYELRATLTGKPGRKLLGTFRTGSVVDLVPPSSGVFDPPVVHPVPKPSPGTILLRDFPQKETFVSLFGTRATDDEATDPALMYAVWSAPAGAALDYVRPPSGLFRPEPLFQATDPRFLFNLGAESDCSVSSFDFPKEGRITVAIRPIDLAGNFGLASLLTIDIPKGKP